MITLETTKLYWRHGVIVLLLASHALWVSMHMHAHYHDNVNPWKLGGYGMYTAPCGPPTLSVETISENPQVFEESDLLTKWFFKKNWAYYYYCKSPSAESIKILMQKNPILRNKDAVITIYKYEFNRENFGQDKFETGRIHVSWSSPNQLSYRAEMCDNKISTGEVTLE